jgi:hypothetical protein
VISMFRWLALLNLVMVGSKYGGALLLAGPSGSVGLFSGRPGTQSVEDFEDMLLAAFAKARSKDKKLTEADHFGVASAAKVRELQTLKKRKDKTCRMLRSCLERLAEETCLLNAREQALTFVNALPAAVQERIEPIL